MFLMPSPRHAPGRPTLLAFALIVALGALPVRLEESRSDGVRVLELQR